MLIAVRLVIPALAVSCLLTGCSSSAPEAAKKTEAPKPKVKPADHGRYFPSKDRGEIAMAEEHLYGHVFLPPGQMASYKSGKTEYQLFLARCADSSAAAVALLDYKKSLPEAKFLAHFGGYFGPDQGAPVFVFTKGPWLAGVRGLPQDAADTVAREFAARLPAE